MKCENTVPKLEKKTITITDHSSNTWVYNAHQHISVPPLRTYTKRWPIKAVTYFGDQAKPTQPHDGSRLSTLNTRL